MKTRLFISALTLGALLGNGVALADNHGMAKEKGVLESMTDAVKETVGDVKKAIIKDGKEDTSADPDSEAGATESKNDAEAKPAAAAPAAPAPAVKAPEAAPAQADGKDDAADAEANKKVSDTSITIFSQNPYIQSIMEKTTHIKSARLKELMARGDKITLVDIRPRAEFGKGNGIKGSINIPRNLLETEGYEKLANKNAAIIIISTKGIRGGLAANTLQNMGYSNVRNLMDGLEGWNKAN